MKILVTGSRDFNNQQILWTALHAANPDIVIHGAAAGADTLAARWCRQNGEIYEIAVPAKWNIHGKAAGHHRNHAMLQLNPNIVLAFYKTGATNRGTQNMVNQAKKAGIPVTTFWES